MGELLGHAVRFGVARDVMAVGEGIETVLSLRGAMPTIPMAAALSAAHLAAIILPPALSRLYIARDDDAAGERACRTLVERARARAIEAIVLSPAQGDFNADLRTIGIDPLRAAIRPQLAPQDVARFLSRSESRERQRAKERPASGESQGSRPSRRRRPRPGVREGERPPSGPDPAMAAAGSFPARSAPSARSAFHREAKELAYAIRRQGLALR